MGNAPSSATTPVNDQLYAAVAEGDLEGVKEVLQRQTPGQRALLAKFANKDGRHILHKAAANGHLELVRLLLECGAPQDAMSRRGRGGSALHEAAAAGQAHVVRLLLDAGVCPFVQNISGQTPMELAMAAKDSASLQLLCHAAPWCGQLQVGVAPHGSTDWASVYCVLAPRLHSQPFGSKPKALSPELVCFGGAGDCCVHFRALVDGCQVLEEEGPDSLGAVRLVVLECTGARHKHYVNSEGEAAALHLRPRHQNAQAYESFRRLCGLLRRPHRLTGGDQTLLLPPMPCLGLDCLGGAMCTFTTHTSQAAAASGPPLADSTCSIEGTMHCQQQAQHGAEGQSQCCVICLDAPRSMGLRHGSSVHRAVCYECARRLVLSGDALCPLCRRPVEEVLAVF